ncbi:unnamed protein product [Effrenium voratum]|nr:unnamed protein product [Effrenium voratum]
MFAGDPTRRKNQRWVSPLETTKRGGGTQAGSPIRHLEAPKTHRKVSVFDVTRLPPSRCKSFSAAFWQAAAFSWWVGEAAVQQMDSTLSHFAWMLGLELFAN